MSREQLANVYTFIRRRAEGTAAGAGPSPSAATAAEADSGEGSPDRVGEMKAVLSCLEYLYGEAVRVQARMSAHLIGAAAESMRREITDAENGDG